MPTHKHSKNNECEKCGKSFVSSNRKLVCFNCRLNGELPYESRRNYPTDYEGRTGKKRQG